MQIHMYLMYSFFKKHFQQAAQVPIEFSTCKQSYIIPHKLSKAQGTPFCLFQYLAHARLIRGLDQPLHHIHHPQCLDPLTGQLFEQWSRSAPSVSISPGAHSAALMLVVPLACLHACSCNYSCAPSVAHCPIWLCTFCSSLLPYMAVHLL